MHLYLSACLFSFLLDVYLVMETLLSFCPKIYMNLNSAGKCLSIAQWREILLMTGFEVLIFWFEILLSNRWPPSPNKTEKQRCTWWGRWGGQKLYEISLHTTPPTSLGLEEAPPDSSALGSSHQNHCSKSAKPQIKLPHQRAADLKNSHLQLHALSESCPLALRLPWET